MNDAVRQMGAAAIARQIKQWKEYTMNQQCYALMDGRCMTVTYKALYFNKIGRRQNEFENTCNTAYIKQVVKIRSIS